MSSPLRIAAVVPPQPTSAGMPISRATTAAWQVRPPWSVTTAAAVFMTVPQSGMVVGATRISSGWNRSSSPACRMTRALPLATLPPTARRDASASPVPSRRYSSSCAAELREATVSGRACTR